MSNGGWGHGGAATEVFWESLGSMEQDYFGILSFQPKIFRSKLLIIKVLNPKAWPFMFGIDSVGKYSVQNWIFIDWSVTMAIGGDLRRARLVLGYVYLYPYDTWCAIVNIITLYGMVVETCVDIVSCLYKCPKRRWRCRLLKH